MSRSGPGWCPFAIQVEGVETFTTGGEPKVGFCDHTAGGFYTTLANPAFWNGQGYSVHFGISRKGDVCQVVNIFDTAWAQGRDARGQPVGPDSPGVSWPPFAAMGKRNPNLYLISTEHEDYELVNGQAHAIPASRWTPEEYAADLRVKRWCANELASHGVDVMRFGLDSLASHHMFDPVNRAYCAGKAWRDEYRQRLFNDIAGGNTMPEPTQDEMIIALVTLGHFIRMRWNLADLSPADKAAIKAAVGMVPA